jgi:hypothetical protein
MCFTISLYNLTSLFSLLFAYFRFKFFASLHLGNFRFAFFRIFYAFFRFFRLKFFASLQFSNFCFKAKQSEAKFKSIFSFFRFFSLFFAFLAFFGFFSLNFRFLSIFSLNFCLFYLCFRFRFLVFRIEVNHVKSGFFLLPSETKFSLQFQISLPKRK